MACKETGKPYQRASVLHFGPGPDGVTKVAVIGLPDGCVTAFLPQALADQHLEGNETIVTKDGPYHVHIGTDGKPDYVLKS